MCSSKMCRYNYILSPHNVLHFTLKLFIHNFHKSKCKVKILYIHHIVLHYIVEGENSDNQLPHVMLRHYTEYACFTPTSQALMACTYLLWNIRGVMVNGVRRFYGFITFGHFIHRQIYHKLILLNQPSTIR
jgi:hypothetical protein